MKMLPCGSQPMSVGRPSAYGCALGGGVPGGGAASSPSTASGRRPISIRTLPLGSNLTTMFEPSSTAQMLSSLSTPHGSLHTFHVSLLGSPKRYARRRPDRSLPAEAQGAKAGCAGHCISASAKAAARLRPSPELRFTGFAHYMLVAFEYLAGAY